jgi:hypothetical protein
MTNNHHPLWDVWYPDDGQREDCALLNAYNQEAAAAMWADRNGGSDDDGGSITVLVAEHGSDKIHAIKITTEYTTTYHAREVPHDP